MLGLHLTQPQQYDTKYDTLQQQYLYFHKPKTIEQRQLVRAQVGRNITARFYNLLCITLPNISVPSLQVCTIDDGVVFPPRGWEYPYSVQVVLFCSLFCACVLLHTSTAVIRCTSVQHTAAAGRHARSPTSMYVQQ